MGSDIAIFIAQMSMSYVHTYVPNYNNYSHFDNFMTTMTND
jgi:hypothetical protein